MRVLVTGASGFIGQHLVRSLLEQSVPVRVVTRDPSRLSELWLRQVEVITGSLTDTATIQAAVKNSTHVFHLAGETSDPSLMRTVNVDATRRIAQAAGAASVARFIHLSSVGVIGANSQDFVTESARCTPQNEYERTKLDGEQAILDAVRASGLDAVIVRPTIVFGEGARRRDSLLEWAIAVLRGRFAFIGRAAVANYVYVGDVVSAMMQLCRSVSSRGEIYHVADPAPLCEFVEAMAEALDVACPNRTVPVWAAYAAGAGMEVAHRLFGLPVPLTRSRVRALSSACRFSGDKLQRQAGVTLPFGYRKGLVNTVQWYREAGRL